MLYHNAPQGSEQWALERIGVITASRYKDARDRLKPAKGETVGKPSAKCIAYAAQVAVERIAQRPIDRVFENWQMREGKEQEPLARDAYDVETGNIVSEVGLITTDDRMFGYSPDGEIGTEGLLEIKTLLSADVILKVIGEGDLSAYMDQCMGGLWLTGRKWIDLVLWAPALATIGRQLTIHRIERDEAAIEALELDLLMFAEMVRDAEQRLRAGAPDAVAEVVAESELEAAQAATPAPTPAAPVIAAPAAAPQAANVVPMPSPRPTTAPTLRLGQINERLHPLSIDAAGLASLGFPPAATEKSAKLYHEADFGRMLDSVVAHIRTVQAKQQRAA